jgi:hypothetical protein
MKYINVLNNNTKDILVIVKNKLMSTDTVLPILIELKEKYNISSIVVVNDKLAHEGINKNVVIRDAINYVGVELYTGVNSSSKIARKLSKIGFLFFLLFKLIKGVKVLHFGIFNVFPFSVIGKVFNENLYFLQSSSFEHSYERFNEIIGRNPSTVTPISRNIVAFNDGMRHLEAVNENHKIFIFGSTRTRESWRSYINERSDNYFYQYHDGVDTSNGCIVFILAYFGELNLMRMPYESLTILLKNTIDVLDEVRGDLPVFLKPHVFTDLSIVDKAIYGLNDFHVTYLHPSVLASKAKVFICNTYSTTMADAKSLGVKTVEYSDYKKEAIELSGGRSTGHEYIDEFINNDKDEFKKVIKSILSINSPSNNHTIFKKENTDADELLARLAE